jgi:phosphoenolpyruvate carboxykinase (ATP)
MKLSHTRAMVNAALHGELDNVKTETDPFFGLAIPAEIKGVPASVLNPRKTWPDAKAYDNQAAKLAGMFRANFEKFGDVDPAIKNAGPKG